MESVSAVFVDLACADSGCLKGHRLVAVGLEGGLMSFIDRTLRSFLLTEILQGMGLTLKYFFRPKVTINYPMEKGPLSPPLSWGTRAAPLSEWGGALYCLQVYEAICPAQAITIEAEPRDDGSHGPRVMILI